MRAGIDVDDVIVEFVHELVTFTNAIRRTDFGMSDITNYHMDMIFDCEEEKDDIIKMFYDSYSFKTLPFVPGFRPVYDALKDKHDIYFITSRYGSAIPITRNMFIEHGLPLDRLVFSRTKGEECKRLGLDFFVDDALHNLDHIIANSDTIPVVYSRPWNVDNTSYSRVNSWAEIHKLFK